MNKYIIICRSGAVQDTGLTPAFGNPCLGIAYAEDERDAIDKARAYHRFLAVHNRKALSWWADLIAYKLDNDTDISTAEYVIR